MHDREAGAVVAEIDFLGEGRRMPAGKLVNFRRGITRYPLPGAKVFRSPATT